MNLQFVLLIQVVLGLVLNALPIFADMKFAYPVDIGKQSSSFYEDPLSVPSFRYNSAMVLDKTRNRLVVFLGYFYDHKNHQATWCKDVWAFSLESRDWSMVHDGIHGVAPEPRYGHTATLIDASRVFVFGGDTGKAHGKKSDAWIFNLSTDTWELLTVHSSTGPSPRSLHASSLIENEAGEKFVVIYGGIKEHDTWLYSVGENTWRLHPSSTLEQLGKRFGAAMTQSASDPTRAYLFGGAEMKSKQIFNDTWQFTVRDGWSLKHSGKPQKDQSNRNTHHRSSPLGRNYLTIVAVANKKRFGDDIVVFGGSNCTGSCYLFNDLWVLDTNTNKWTEYKFTNDVYPRYHHSVVVDQETRLLYSFGGETYKPTYMYHNSVMCLELGFSLKSCESRLSSIVHNMPRYRDAIIVTILMLITVVSCYLCIKTRPKHSVTSDASYKTE
eukprot:m.195892 g.195892  ORF g.195892 m.195892 type:complete len:440 (-) comp13671_c2_seq21:10-1329(-)